MIMQRGLLSVLLVTVAAVCGCARDTDTTGLPQRRFIEVIVELRRAAQDGETAQFAARKQQILEKAGVTEEQLRAYVKTHERDLEHMAAVWESINVRLTQPPPATTQQDSSTGVER
jgi:hypothetical protein